MKLLICLMSSVLIVGCGKSQNAQQKELPPSLKSDVQSFQINCEAKFATFSYVSGFDEVLQHWSSGSRVLDVSEVGDDRIVANTVGGDFVEFNKRTIQGQEGWYLNFYAKVQHHQKTHDLRISELLCN